MIFATKETTTLNIFVCVKQVPDIRSNIIPNVEAGYIETEHLHWVINPEDECAVEQALLFRECIPDASITAVRVGDKQDSEALISAMAMGADDAILVKATDKQLDPFMTAQALKGAIEYSGKQPDLILCGNESFGDESNTVPQILAQMLNQPCVTRIMKCSIDDTTLRLERQIEGGVTEKYKFSLPGVVAYNYGINTPRYAPLPHIKSAHQKPLIELNLDEVGIADNDQRLCYSNFRPAPGKKAGKVFYAVDKTEIENVVKEVVKILYSDHESLLGYPSKK